MKIPLPQIFLVLSMAHATWLNGKPVNLFIELNKDQIKIGAYDSLTYAAEYYMEYEKDNLDVDEIKAYLFSNTAESILVYFHSLLGSVSPYHKDSLRKLEKIEGIDKIITIVWYPGSIRYKEAWRSSADTGRELGELLNQLLQEKENRYSVLCHSMGNRIFEGVVSNLDSGAVTLDHVFLAASDLDINIFEHGLSRIGSFCKSVTVYVNAKDKLLKMSKAIHRRERLGLDLDEARAESLSCSLIEVIDITAAKSNRRKDPSGHLYFKNNPTVLRDIKLVLNGNETKRETYFAKRTTNYIQMK